MRAVKKVNAGKSQLRNRVALDCVFSTPLAKRPRRLCFRDRRHTVHNLAYAQRLGLWGGECPLRDARGIRHGDQAGGVAAMEVLARDLRRSDS